MTIKVTIVRYKDETRVFESRQGGVDFLEKQRSKDKWVEDYSFDKFLKGQIKLVSVYDYPNITWWTRINYIQEVIVTSDKKKKQK